MLAAPKSYLAAALSSTARLNGRRYLYEVGRRLRGQAHQVEVFLQIDDPYSYLLLQVLPVLQQRFAVQWRPRMVLDREPDMFPEAQMLNAHAHGDAQHLAALYDLHLPVQAPIWTSNSRQLATEAALALEQGPQALTELLHLFTQMWAGQPLSAPAATDGGSQLRANELRRKALGHYASAMLYYAGEWYWGLDRLDHLEQRLNTLQLNRDHPQQVYVRTWQDFCTQPATSVQRDGPPLEIFVSIRSPYSHPGFLRAVQLAEHYQLPVCVRPVLPMLLRGLAVPPRKKWYIFHDTCRETRKLGLPYGRIADPLGGGVERCYALFAWAQAQGKAVAYWRSFTLAVNSQGISSQSDAGLRVIVERAGLDWAQAQPLLTPHEWPQWLEDNRQAMYAAGLWGVPSFRYGTLQVWGQDRLGVLEQAIRKGAAESGRYERFQ